MTNLAKSSPVDGAASTTTAAPSFSAIIAKLYAEREGLRVRMRSLTGALAIERPAEQMEATMAEQSRERTAAELRRLRDLAAQVECAIKRWDLGVFGWCECGVAISPQRLAAVPFAELCLKCQGKIERREMEEA